MSVPYSAIITAQDVSDHAESSFDLDITEAKTLLVVESLIGQVTGMLEGAIGLNRQLMVRQYVDYVDTADWEYDNPRSLYRLKESRFPLVEVDTAGFTLGQSRYAYRNENDLLLYSSRHCGAITYYAGYRRTEQDLGNLQDGGVGEGSLTDLATLPPALPEDIRNVAINGVLMLLTERRAGPGERTKVMNPAIQSTTIQETISDYIKRMVKERISHHRVLV